MSLHIKTKTEIVSLGSSCSVAFQQQTLGLRSQSLPFDWLQTDSFDDVIKCLESSLIMFSSFDVKQKVRTSVNFPVFNTDTEPFPQMQDSNLSCSRIIENNHRFRFCHDFNSSEDLAMQIPQVTEKYQRRIQRLKLLLDTQPLHFVRDELKPKTLTQLNLQNFLVLMDKQCKYPYHLTVIASNPTNLILPLFDFRDSRVTIINDTSPWVNWQRSDTDWKKIFISHQKDRSYVQTQDTSIELINKVNYRNKICVNLFDAKKKRIIKYEDLVSLPDLIANANIILNEIIKLSDSDQLKFNYFVIEKSNESGEYAIKFVMSGVKESDLIHKIMIALPSDFKMIAYQRQHGDPQLHYLTNNLYFQDTYEGTPWQHQIDSFIQPIPELSQVIHQSINTWMLKDQCNFLGLSGEMGYYASHNRKHLKEIVLLSNKAIRTEDCQRNLGHCAGVTIASVQYDQCSLINYAKHDPTNWILLVNMSKGLEKLISEVMQIPWKQILYIGCKVKCVEQDLKMLLKTYRIDHRVQIQLPNGTTETVMDLRPQT
jgi:hypothetical protein